MQLYRMIGIALLPAALFAGSVVAASIHKANTSLGRGINLGNALEAPTEGAWGITLKAEYFKTIKEAGFATVRLPVRWSAHALPEAPYTIDPTFAARVDWAVAQALTNGLNVIVNVHHYDGMDLTPDTNLPRLIGLWQQIAARYKNQSDHVYFELLNEPHAQLTEAKWNAAIPPLLAAIRTTNPTRAILVGPGMWNSVDRLDALKLPEHEHHLIVTVHFYFPFHFTHQGASWVNGSEAWLGTPWMGTETQKQAIHEPLSRVAAWSKAHHRPICLGEFGAYEKADLESRVRWTRFVARESERLGFSWAYWEFCAGFGAYDPIRHQWRERLKSALIE